MRNNISTVLADKVCTSALFFRNLLKSSALLGLFLLPLYSVGLMGNELDVSLTPIGAGTVFPQKDGDGNNLATSVHTPMAVTYYDEETNLDYLVVFWKPEGEKQVLYTYARFNPELPGSLVWSNKRFIVSAPNNTSIPFKSTNRPEPIIHDNKLFVFGRADGNAYYVYYDLNNGIQNLFHDGQVAQWEGSSSALFKGHNGMLSVINTVSPSNSSEKLVFSFRENDSTKPKITEGKFDNTNNEFIISDKKNFGQKNPDSTPGITYHAGKIRGFYPDDYWLGGNEIYHSFYENIEEVEFYPDNIKFQGSNINSANRPFPISFRDDLYLLWKKHGEKRVQIMWSWDSESENPNIWGYRQELDFKTSEAPSAVIFNDDLYVLYIDDDNDNAVSYQVFSGFAKARSNSMSMSDVEGSPDCNFTFETRADEDFEVHHYRNCSAGAGAASAEERFDYGPIQIRPTDDPNTWMPLTSQGVPFAAQRSGLTFLVFRDEGNVIRTAELIVTDDESWINSSSALDENLVKTRTSPTAATYRNRIYTFYSEAVSGKVMAHWTLNDQEHTQAISNGEGGFITTANRPFAFNYYWYDEDYDLDHEYVFVFYLKDDDSNQIGYVYANKRDSWDYALQWQGGEHTLDLFEPNDLTNLTSPSAAVFNDRVYAFFVTDKGYFYSSTSLANFENGSPSGSTWTELIQLRYQDDALVDNEDNDKYPISMLATTTLIDDTTGKDIALVIGYYNAEGVYIEERCYNNTTESNGTLLCQ